MIIECIHCKARYQYDEERFERKPAKKIRCAKCQEVFEIRNPAFAVQAVPESNFDTTAKGKTLPPEPKKKPIEETTASTTIPRGEEPERSTGKQEAAPRLPDTQRLSIAVIDGPDAGQVYRIEKPRVVIGRANADMVINDSEASRNHAAVEVRESLVLLEDLGSTNGTLVGGQRIDGPVELRNHGEFAIGGSTLMLIVTDSSTTIHP